MRSVQTEFKQHNLQLTEWVQQSKELVQIHRWTLELICQRNTLLWPSLFTSWCLFYGGRIVFTLLLSSIHCKFTLSYKSKCEFTQNVSSSCFCSVMITHGKPVPSAVGIQHTLHVIQQGVIFVFMEKSPNQVCRLKIGCYIISQYGK